MTKKLYHRLELVLFLGLFIVWTAFIWHNSMEPANVSGSKSLYITDVINSILAPVHIQLTDHIVRKAAHFAEYAISGALMFGIMTNLLALLRSNSIKKPIRKSDGIVILIGFMIAFVDEVIQRFTPGRSCQLSDMMLDTAGFACGYLFFLAVFSAITALRHRPS